MFGNFSFYTLELKKKLNRIHEKEIKAESPLKVIHQQNKTADVSKWNKRTLFSIAASILFLLFAGYWLTQNDPPQEEIFSSSSKKAFYEKSIVAQTWSDQASWNAGETFQVLIFENEDKANVYTFDGEVLALFTNNRKVTIPLELYQVDDLILKWGSSYFQIKTTEDVEPLVALSPDDIPAYLPQ